MENPMFDCDLDHISFAEWLIRLNSCAIKAGYTGSQPIAQITGQLCWYPFYEGGLTPDAALEAAAQEGEEFGNHYDAL